MQKSPKTPNPRPRAAEPADDAAARTVDAGQLHKSDPSHVPQAHPAEAQDEVQDIDATAAGWATATNSTRGSRATTDQTPGRRSPRARRMLVAASLVALAVYFLPELIGRTGLRNVVARILIHDPRLELTMHQASLGWNRPIEFQGLVLRNDRGERLANIGRLRLDATLWDLLWHRPHEVNAVVHGPRITVQLKDGRTNFHLPPRPKEPERPGVAKRARMDLRLKLRDARLELLDERGETHAATTIPELDLELVRDENRRWLIIEPVELWNHLPVSAELVDAGLKYVAPALADAAWIRGASSLRLNVCRIDVNEPAESVVHGVLTLHQVQTGPKGLVTRVIAQIAGELRNMPAIESVHVIRDSEVVFRLEEGRVHHQGLALGLPDVAPELVVRTSGSVGLDGSLDMQLSIPLAWHLLRRGEPSVPAGRMQMLEVPLRGTFEQPRLELTGQGRLARAILGGLTETLTGEPLPPGPFLPGDGETEGPGIDWLSPQTFQSLEPLVGELAERLRERRAMRQGEPDGSEAREAVPSIRRPLRDRLRRRRARE